MNYIKRLEKEVEDLRAEKEEALRAVADMERYLLSEKFRCGDVLDYYVNVEDVRHRLQPVKSAVLP